MNIHTWIFLLLFILQRLKKIENIGVIGNIRCSSCLCRWLCWHMFKFLSKNFAKGILQVFFAYESRKLIRILHWSCFWPLKESTMFPAAQDCPTTKQYGVAAFFCCTLHSFGQIWIRFLRFANHHSFQFDFWAFAAICRSTQSGSWQATLLGAVSCFFPWSARSNWSHGRLPRKSIRLDGHALLPQEQQLLGYSEKTSIWVQSLSRKRTNSLKQF